MPSQPKNNLFMYLHAFLTPKNAEVYPEFPTGNGRIDIIIKYGVYTYGIEVKSFTDGNGYDEALLQAATYGMQLNLLDIYLVFFVEYIDDDNRKKYEAMYLDKATGVRVFPFFVETGN